MTINHAHRFFIFHLKQKAQKMYDKIWENLNILASLNMHLWFFPPFSPLVYKMWCSVLDVTSNLSEQSLPVLSLEQNGRASAGWRRQLHHRYGLEEPFTTLGGHELSTGAGNFPPAVQGTRLESPEDKGNISPGNRTY